MKKLLTILCLVLLVSCSPPPEVPFDKLVERQGITYKVNSTTPFTGSSVTYHENGQLQKKINYKNGEQDGLYETFYDNFQLNRKGNLKNNKEEGFWELFYENGQLEQRGNFKKGLKIKYYVIS